MGSAVLIKESVSLAQGNTCIFPIKSSGSLCYAEVLHLNLIARSCNHIREGGPDMHIYYHECACVA